MRPGAVGENGIGFGEPELDANSALTELDKGLRSTKLGEQVEAIVRFPALFERYPFPILINSAFLKLADVFRTGSNFLRLWILRVCQQSERHLDKIMNVEEFIRRICSVIYANDPIARALTLRTLGSLAGLIPENKPVHHSIRVALDSHDKVEVSAAIHAASCFAQKSKTFGTTMYAKIASMVQRLSTPIDLKMHLIPIFQHMHHDSSIVLMVRKLCQDLLISYPSEQFVVTILHTLTQLAASTITDLTDQVSFLLHHLCDTRIQVKLSILKDLKFLGKRGGHLWESSHIEQLLNATLPEPEQRERDDVIHCDEIEILHGTLFVLNSLTSSSSMVPLLTSTDTSLWVCIKRCVLCNDSTISLQAIQIATNLAINWKEDQGNLHRTEFVKLACVGVESLLLNFCSISVKDAVKPSLLEKFERCLSYGVILCKMNRCDWYITILIKLLKSFDTTASYRNLIVQGIGAIGETSLESIQRVLPDIIYVIKTFDVELVKEESSTTASLVGLLFLAHQGYSLNSKCAGAVHHVLKLSNLWLAYRIARNSFRFAQPEYAVLALKNMHTKVSSENFHYWLSALRSIAEAEEILISSDRFPNMISRLNRASNLYIQGVSAIKAASSPSMSLQFQMEYLRIRSEMLVAFVNFLVSCNTLQLSPPAAIAASIALNMRDDFLKSGRVVPQLRKTIRDFNNIADMYGRLYQTAFDADKGSLLNINVLQHLCRLVARCIEKQVVSKDHPSFSDDDHSMNFFNELTYETSGNSWSIILSCRKAIEVMRGVQTQPLTGIVYEQIERLREAARIIIESPMPFPRFFFQTLQMTRVKIAVSPQPRVLGEPVTVLPGNNLALKVEGVIQQNSAKSDDGKSTSVLKKPKAIRLTVTSTPIPNPRSHMMDPIKANQEPITLMKEVVPHRDFFQAQFLLIVAQGGLTTVTVDTSLVDFEGKIWMTGPRATLSVKVHDDSGLIKQSGGIMMSGPGPSRPMNPGNLGVVGPPSMRH